MSDCFADHAARLSGQVCALLGWRPAEFWAATPAELAAIIAALAGDVEAAHPPDPGLVAQLMKEHPDG